MDNYPLIHKFRTISLLIIHLVFTFRSPSVHLGMKRSSHGKGQQHPAGTHSGLHHLLLPEGVSGTDEEAHQGQDRSGEVRTRTCEGSSSRLRGRCVLRQNPRPRAHPGPCPEEPSTPAPGLLRTEGSLHPDPLRPWAIHHQPGDSADVVLLVGPEVLRPRHLQPGRSRRSGGQVAPPPKR